MSEQQATTKMFEVILEKPHTHAGAALQNGARIKVNAPDRDWLIAQGIARPAEPEKGGDK